MKKELVGKRIKELCDEQGITINKLAVIASVPPSTLKNIIYGQVENTGVETISKICDGLGISIKQFFDSTDFECRGEEENGTEN